MKSYTDVEQSKKLAVSLPIESADVWWAERYGGKVTHDGQYIVNEEPIYYISFIKPSEINYSQDTVKDIPCWSLAALIDYLAKKDCFPEITYTGTCYLMDVNFYDDEEGKLLHPIHFIRTEGKSLVDACVEMVLKLKEKDLL